MKFRSLAFVSILVLSFTPIAQASAHFQLRIFVNSEFGITAATKNQFDAGVSYQVSAVTPQALFAFVNLPKDSPLVCEVEADFNHGIYAISALNGCEKAP